MESNKKLWFKAKQYGWGWSPATWEGWTVVAIYVIGTLIVSISKASTTPFPMGEYLLFLLAATVVLVIICFLKGEKPRWQWGEKK